MQKKVMKSVLVQQYPMVVGAMVEKKVDVVVVLIELLECEHLRIIARVDRDGDSGDNLENGLESCCRRG